MRISVAIKSSAKRTDEIRMAGLVIPFLQLLVKQKGSDLHVAASSSPMIRIRGDLVKVESPAHTAKDVEQIVNEITSPEQKKAIAEEKTVDFAIKVSGLGVFRVNVFFQRHGMSIVFRALAEKPPTIEELNLPPICRAACSYPNGLVLVTGPTGSGKSTTLAAMLNYINTNYRMHILTLEDPIEFQHETKRCMVNQRQLGDHFTNFASALKAALREDPDVILVGEMRDPETIALAITAAETGHLVFGTLHTNSAPKAVDRILDSFPADEQPQIRAMLSESLRAVVSQKLVPTADRKGRLAVHDILVATPAISNLIREGKVFQIPSAMQTGRRDGMVIMDSSLLDAVKQGKVSGPDAWEYANDKALFAQWAPRDAMAGTHTGTAGSTNAPPAAPGVPPAGTGGTAIRKVGT
jgi:twitching motility protein PilT